MDGRQEGWWGERALDWVGVEKNKSAFRIFAVVSIISPFLFLFGDLSACGMEKVIGFGG